MFIAMGTGSPELIVETEIRDRLKQILEVDSVHHSEAEHLQTEFKSHIRAEHEKVERKPYDCKEELKIYPKLDEYCKRLIGRMTKFGTMWHCNLARISFTKNCIELTSDKTQLVHWAPYRAERKSVSLRRWRSMRC